MPAEGRAVAWPAKQAEHAARRPAVAAQEMILLELYRRGTISSGKAAELLGIPFIDMTPDEWEAEKAALEAWPRS